MIPLPDLGPTPFLAALGPRDRSWPRVAAMAGGGLALAFILGLAMTFAAMEALSAAGIDLINPVFHEPQLIRASGYVLELSLALGAAALGVLIAARGVFGRPIRSWITAAPRFRWRQLALGFGLAFIGVALVSQAVGVFKGGSLTADAPILAAAEPLGRRLIYLAANALGFLLAAWAEEAVFRGYVLQQVAALTRRPYAALWISGLLFALVHAEFSPYALAARTIIGAAFAWTALRLGGLEFAIGAHLANNLMIALFGAPMLPGTSADPGDALGVATETLMALYLAVCAELIRRRAPRPA
ncbi:CPBP family intramembrane glutamic endopeptidase [Phenylobacterium aquaticum]|uniref:CPBP family intramembrane glutamic endopeptidase n=1 Tax=Phenylobacterium aquaticum TaxID=1763816 RepID=UPI0026F17590|nr:CPBP family intramembrane glutamic endopeptidase [Phenylobacterium aquaticum]